MSLSVCAQALVDGFDHERFECTAAAEVLGAGCPTELFLSWRSTLCRAAPPTPGADMTRALSYWGCLPLGFWWGGPCCRGRHCTVFSNTCGHRPDHQCQDARKKAVPENAVFTEAYDGRQERNEEGNRPD
jgi:hypothetical protein